MTTQPLSMPGEAGVSDGGPDWWAYVQLLSPDIRHRLERGQKFNEYDLSRGGVAVCLGPVTDMTFLVETDTREAAEFIVAALRHFVGQPPLTAPLASRQGADQ